MTTRQENKELAEIEKKRRLAFSAICQTISAQLGLPDFDSLPELQKAPVYERAHDALSRVLNTHSPDPATPLQKLLAEHHDLSQRISDIFEANVARRREFKG